MKSRPERVRILGKDYRIEFIKEGTPPIGDDAMGFHDLDKLVISIQDDIHWQQQASTILHECIHAIDEQAGAKLTEEQILALECGLYALLNENPHLVDYLTNRKK